MSHALLDTVTAHFAELDDPRRQNNNRRHEFVDILTIALCAVIGGANHWTTVVTFAQAKEDWLRRFLRLPNGIPSHDTFSDVFARIDPETFERCFIAWVRALAVNLPGVEPTPPTKAVVETTETNADAASAPPVVAIDGKTLRRSHDRSRGVGAAHIVSAYASAQALVLGQIRTSDKSNEITAIPTLLDMLELDGALVTIDAMGCQKAIAEKILERGADYLLTVKENQPGLCEAIGNAFVDRDRERFARRFGEPAEQSNRGHGRTERRQCWVCTDEQVIEPLAKSWTGLRSVVVIDSERTVDGGEKTSDVHWYISSRAATAEEFLPARRKHWSVENALHWVLDVAFREDESRVRVGDGAENLSVLRRIALNLLKREKTHKGGIEAKRCRAGWDERYMETVLSLLA